MLANIQMVAKDGIAAAAVQLAIVLLSNSVSLMADTIHNFGDAATAVPLAVAFLFSRKKPTTRFTYGYGRVEDFAGILIVLVILMSAVLAGYEAIQRLIHPEVVTHLGTVIAASIIGFLGNEVRGAWHTRPVLVVESYGRCISRGAADRAPVL